jgi:hypothetical protein
VWRFVFGSANLRHASIRCHHHQRRELILQCTVQEGEALDIEHVNFINEQYLGLTFRYEAEAEISATHPRHDFCLPFLPPFLNLGVDLGP